MSSIVLSTKVDPQIKELLDRLTSYTNMQKKEIIALAILEFVKNHYPKLINENYKKIIEEKTKEIVNETVKNIIFENNAKEFSELLENNPKVKELIKYFEEKIIIRRYVPKYELEIYNTETKFFLKVKCCEIEKYLETLFSSKSKPKYHFLSIIDVIKLLPKNIKFDEIKDYIGFIRAKLEEIIIKKLENYLNTYKH